MSGDELPRQNLSPESVASDPPTMNVTLASNETLRMTANRLKSTAVDWDQLMESILYGKSKHRDASVLRGLLAETHVTATLQAAAESNTLPGPLDTYPIVDLQMTPHYQFYMAGDDQLYVRDRKSGKTFAEYDAVIQADDLITVCEVKITSRRVSRGSSRSQASFNGSFSPNVINEKFAPIQELYPRNTYGYVVIGSADIVNAKEQENGRNGALVVGLPATLLDFQEHAERLSSAIHNRNLRTRPKTIYRKPPRK